MLKGKKAMKYVMFLFAISFPVLSHAHSGDTDQNGCHAGTKPYHCHNAKTGNDIHSWDIDADWDVSIGYQHHFAKHQLIPFVGLSIGESEKTSNPIDDSDSINLGYNVGLAFERSWYMGYVSTSDSIQLGYKFVHLSASSNAFGLGLRFPLCIIYGEHSGFYGSGSVLFK